MRARHQIERTISARLVDGIRVTDTRSLKRVSAGERRRRPWDISTIALASCSCSATPIDKTESPDRRLVLLRAMTAAPRRRSRQHQ